MIVIVFAVQPLLSGMDKLYSFMFMRILLASALRKSFPFDGQIILSHNDNQITLSKGAKREQDGPFHVDHHDM